MTEIIDLERPALWPMDLTAYLKTHYDVIERWERQSSGGVSLVSGREYDRMISGLCDILKNFALIGWHCTRLTEDEITAMKAHGMQLPNAEILKRRVDHLEDKGLLAPQVAKRLRAKNQAHEETRAGRIWFCFFPPHIAGEPGIASLLRNWGGEALYNSHDNDLETGSILKSIGIPCLVEAVVLIASLRCEHLAIKITHRFLVSRGFDVKEPLEYKDRTIQPLPPECIRRIIRFPEEDFIALTKSDGFTAPLV